MTDSGRAWRAGQDPRAVQRRLRAAHDRFVATGEAGPGVRDVVAESWARCVRGGLDPERSLAPVDLVDDALLAHRSAHPLGAVMPVIRRLLVDDAQDAGLLVAVSDAAGRLLWVEGERAARAAAPDALRRGRRLVGGPRRHERPRHRAGARPPGADLRRRAPVAAGHPVEPVRPHRSTTPTPAPCSGPSTSPVATRSWRRTRCSLVRATVAAVESEPEGAAAAGRAADRRPGGRRRRAVRRGARPRPGRAAPRRRRHPAVAAAQRACWCCWPRTPRV
nr:hypothetical protein [Angustibacter aerolatus]